MAHNETIIFAWDVPEFNYKEKKVDWYWWVGIIAVAGILLSILVWKNYIFAFFILIAGFLIIMQSKRKPGLSTIEISPQGIKFAGRFLPYESLDAFWIESGAEDRPARLMLHTSSVYAPFDPMPIHPNIDIVELRDFLLDFMNEQEMHESLLQKLLHRLGL